MDVSLFKLKTLELGYYYLDELSRVSGELDEHQYRIENIIEKRGNKSLFKFIGFKKNLNGYSEEILIN